MRKVILSVVIGLFVFGSIGNLKSQNAITGSGFTSGWDPFGSGDIEYFGEIISGSYGTTLQANGTGNQYFRICVDWSGTKTQHTSSPGSDTEVLAGSEILLSSTNTSSGALYTNVTSTSHNYVFKTRDAGTSPSFDLVFFKVEGTIRSVSSVVRDITDVYPGQDVVVTSTLDGAFSTGQGVYLRYTNDNFSSSTVVEMTGSGTTYTATIPSSFNSASSSIEYYIFTSGNGLTITSGNADWYTINLNNNGGSNYSYTVNAAHTTKSGATVWSATSSWDAGVVPVSDQPVKIEDNISLDQNATVSYLTVNANRTLDVNSGNLLTVNNDLEIVDLGIIDVNTGASVTLNGTVSNNHGSDGLILRSSSSGQGSLIYPKTGGTSDLEATVERYIAKYNNNDDGWHLLASPMESYLIDSEFAPTINVEDLYYWDEDEGTNGTWINYHNGSGGNGFTSFVNGRGYICSYSTSGVRTFASNLIAADITFSNQSYSSGSTNAGWHLFGNPYAAALDVSDYASGEDWAVSNFSVPQLYIESAGDYFPASDFGNIIPSTQGFFVQASSGTNSITIPADTRTHNHTQSWHKSDVSYVNAIQLKITSTQNDFYNLATVGFDEQASNLYDVRFDARKLNGAASAPRMYTLDEAGDKYCLNYLKDEQSSRLINLHFRPGVTGEHTIEVNHNSLELLDQVYLEDLFENQMIELSSVQSYTFSAEVGDNEDRFKLHFGATGIEEVQKASLQAYVSGGQLYILGEEGKAELNIYNLQGQQLFNKIIVLNDQYSRVLDLKTGIYLVSLQTENNIKTAKVIIK